MTISFEIPYPKTREGKMIVDVLRGTLLREDNRKHVIGISHGFWDGDSILVEINEAAS